MLTLRKECMSLDATPYDHSISRCVRRAFYAVWMDATDESYEHRRDWIESRIVKLV